LYVISYDTREALTTASRARLVSSGRGHVDGRESPPPSGGLLVSYRSGQQSKGRHMGRADNAEVAAVQGSDGSGAVPLGDRDDDCVGGAQG
jgi:hypothetical protein